MIQRKLYGIRADDVMLYRTFSDADVMIRKVGTSEIYSEAIDVQDAPFTYEETDIPCEKGVSEA